MLKYLMIDEMCYFLPKNKKYTLGNNLTNDILIELKKTYTIIVDEDKIKIMDKTYGIGTHIIKIEHKKMYLIISKKPKYIFFNKNSCFISNKEYADIVIADKKLEIIFNKQEVISNFPFYVNGKLYSNTHKIKDYDLIVFKQGYVFSKIKEIIKIETSRIITTKYPQFNSISYSNENVNFTRSPRMTFNAPTETIKILSAPVAENDFTKSLLKIIIMPLMTIILTLITYFLSPVKQMIILMLGMSITTILTSLHTYFSDVKKNNLRKKEDINNYELYLKTKYEKLNNLAFQQEKALLYHYPNFKILLDMALQKHYRIYEKTIHHFDFLTYRLGDSKLKPSFKMEYSTSELTKYNSVITKKINALFDYYKFTKPLPLINNILNGSIGYIGNRTVILEQLHHLILQIAFFQSYHDIVFIPIFPKEEYTMWEWARWLPHMTLPELNMNSFIYDEDSLEKKLGIIYETIKKRKLEINQNSYEKKMFFKHYLIIITNFDLISNHKITEYMHEDLVEIGIHFLFIDTAIFNLHEYIKTIIEYKSEKEAVLILQNNILLKQSFQPLKKISYLEKESFTRALASINHKKLIQNYLPNTVTFFDLYHIDEIQQLEIAQRWLNNDASKSLAVPIGLCSNKDIVYLNLHEKAHGPHGLIAGTTGSGKSELIQSYVLSLAINYHPHEVAILLIDYKGGGMANLFSTLPHLVGMITNLDKIQAQRALISIKAELQKRQKLFLEHNVTNINQYIKLSKASRTKIALPHLFIIVDEFAELKVQQPEFMNELISISRIGRSLGIHLILATQKPSGVVDEQIWSNAKFKIALKVQDEHDSLEIIKTKDASKITEVGRAYLQVGNNEVYELFQSAWCGADYVQQKEIANNIVYEIQKDGTYKAMNTEKTNKFQQLKKQTQFDIIKIHIETIFYDLKLHKIPSPWLPPLKKIVYLEDLYDVDYQKKWNKLDHSLKAIVGYEDIPSAQLQQNFVIDFNESGHILIVGSPGFGKSTLLQTMCIDLMRNYTPIQIHFYLYDFGTNGLISLIDFPHIADYFTLSEVMKIKKSFHFFKQEIARRKKILQKNAFATIHEYNKITKEYIPTLFLMIDGYDRINSSDIVDEFYEELNTIAKEGHILSIFLIVATLNLSSIKFQLQTVFKTKIALYLFEKSDLLTILEKNNLYMEEIKGRALIKKTDVIYFQIALAYPLNNYYNNVKKEAIEMQKNWKGKVPAKIPILPSKILDNKIDLTKINNDSFVLGLFEKDLSYAIFSLQKSILLIGDTQLTIANYYKLLIYNLNRIKYNSDITILDTKNQCKEQLDIMINYLTKQTQIQKYLETVINELKKRIKYNEYGKKYLIVILDTTILEQLKKEDAYLLINKGEEYGMTLITIAMYNDLFITHHNSCKILIQAIKQVFISMRINDQEYVKFPFIVNEPYLKYDEGFIIEQYHYEMVKLINLLDVT